MTNSKQNRRQSGQRQRAARAALALAVVFGLGVVATPPARAQTYKESTFFTFADCLSEGCRANQSLIRDAAGNLYGTTYAGGAGGWGTVFKLDVRGTETVLYGFTGNADGGDPSPGLVPDNAGNFYGTTRVGGAYGYGTVFRVSENGKETVLHSFGKGTDGYLPLAGLVMDSAGNLYGTTVSGGFGEQNGYGTVFKLSKSGKETVLHRFTGNGDGGNPWTATLILDDEGNLYGTTSVGGTGPCLGGCGTVFKMSKQGHETVLHSFAGNFTDGIAPLAGVVRDAKGNLYGTTSGNGPNGNGIVFKVTKGGMETVLYSFTGAFNGDDGASPYSGLVRDKAGNLYGATYYGGLNQCDDGNGVAGCGTIFRLDTKGKETVLYRFAGGTDGAYPSYGNLLRGAKGNLYGVTYGQSGNASLIFKLTP
jgi:uncharacterized repeat protein (TIGR03803 family)